MSPHLCSLYGQTPLHRKISSLACHGKTLQALFCRLLPTFSILCITNCATIFKTWLLNIYSSHIMNTEWLYKCQEGAGELSLGKDTKYYSSFQWKNFLWPCQYSFNQEVFQPVHMLVIIQLINQMIDFSNNWLFNHSINLSQFNYHAVWRIRKHWDQLMKIEFMERIKQESI